MEGALQWSVLRTVLPTIQARDWVGVTIAIAALGWFVGMLPSTLAGPAAPMASEPALLTMIALAAAFGAVVGAIFGSAQWLVLAVGALAGALMGLMVAIATGIALNGIVRETRPAVPRPDTAAADASVR